MQTSSPNHAKRNPHDEGALVHEDQAKDQMVCIWIAGPTNQRCIERRVPACTFLIDLMEDLEPGSHSLMCNEPLCVDARAGVFCDQVIRILTQGLLGGVFERPPESSLRLGADRGSPSSLPTRQPLTMDMDSVLAWVLPDAAGPFKHKVPATVPLHMCLGFINLERQASVIYQHGKLVNPFTLAGNVGQGPLFLGAPGRNHLPLKPPPKIERTGPDPLGA